MLLWFCKGGWFLGPVLLAPHPAWTQSCVWERGINSVLHTPCWVLGGRNLGERNLISSSETLDWDLIPQPLGNFWTAGPALCRAAPQRARAELILKLLEGFFSTVTEFEVDFTPGVLLVAVWTHTGRTLPQEWAFPPAMHCPALCKKQQQWQKGVV